MHIAMCLLTIIFQCNVKREILNNKKITSDEIINGNRRLFSM